MSPTRKKRLLRTTLILVLLPIILTALLFSRFHFSHQDHPRLARLQQN